MVFALCTIFYIYRIWGIQIWHEYYAAIRIKIHIRFRSLLSDLTISLSLSSLILSWLSLVNTNFPFASLPCVMSIIVSTAEPKIVFNSEYCGNSQVLDVFSNHGEFQTVVCWTNVSNLHLGQGGSVSQAPYTCFVKVCIVYRGFLLY